MTLLYIFLIILPLVVAQQCNTTEDCSLNGDCVNNKCICDPWWSGSPNCDVLALLPASKTDGYHNSSGIASWGGMSIRDNNNMWHLFA